MLRDFFPLKIVFSFPKIPKIFRSTLTGLRIGLRLSAMWVLDATGLRIGLRLSAIGLRLSAMWVLDATGFRIGLRSGYRVQNRVEIRIHRVEIWVEIRLFREIRVENRVEICQFPQTGLRKTYAT